MTLAIILVILAVVVIWVIGVQNRLVKSDEKCNNALKQINVQQISRYDALKALIKLTREYASYEADTLEKIVKERKHHLCANADKVLHFVYNYMFVTDK